MKTLCERVTPDIAGFHGVISRSKLSGAPSATCSSSDRSLSQNEEASGRRPLRDHRQSMEILHLPENPTTRDDGDQLQPFDIFSIRVAHTYDHHHTTKHKPYLPNMPPCSSALKRSPSHGTPLTSTEAVSADYNTISWRERSGCPCKGALQATTTTAKLNGA